MMILLAVAAPLLLLGLLDGDDGPETVETDGTDGDDTLNGGAANDLMRGLDGDDEMNGGAGDDTLLGFEGTDVLMGNGGNDMLCAGDDNDVISGGQGFDEIEGQGGNDWADGGYSNDGVYGFEGDDTLIGGRGMDRVGGGSGDDVVYGGILRGVPLEDDEMQALADGQSLADILAESNLEIDLREDDRMDTLMGGSGNDMIFVGNTDMATGGDGEDTFHLMFDDDNSQTPLAQVMDYTAGVDSPAVVYDAPLEVTEITIETDGDDAIVVANGQQLAVVTGAAGTLTADDVTIIQEDAIVGLFDPNAPAPAAVAAA